MENLTQWIVYGVLIAVFHMFIGYHIAQLSREVRKNLDKPVLDGISMPPLKLFLYPIITAETLNNKEPFWILNENKYNETSYVVKHLFLWPLRIIGNLVTVVVLFVVVPIAAFLMSLVSRMVIGSIKAVAGKIKNEASF